MVKLIAVDLDGTLLPDDHQISDRTKKLIRKVVDQGICFVVATGRPYKTAKKFLSELKLKQPMILHSGSILRDQNGEIAKYWEIPSALCEEIISYCNEQGFVCSTIYEDCAYVIINENNPFCMHMHRTQHDTEAVVARMPDWGKDGRGLPVTKILVSEEQPELVDEKVSMLQEVFGNRVNVMKSGKWFIDIIPKGVSKGSSVQVLAEKMGIDKEEVMAIGDSGNDVEMLDYATYSVAMGNSETFVKQRASYVTATNNEEGVARAIEAVLKGRTKDEEGSVFSASL